MKRKRFRVDVDVRAVETYYVNANNAQEALNKVQNGDYEKNDYSIDIHSSDFKNADIFEE